MPIIRLNKLLSQAGVASRRTADELIAQGRVEVNGSVVSELGGKANPESDDIRVDGRRLKLNTTRRYILLNKPRSVLSTRSDPHQRRTVVDLLADAGVRGYFYPVGRLDYDSEGLILLTNDGDFAERVTHPRYELERTYEAVVEGVPDERDLERLRTGIVIDGRRTLPAVVRLVRVLEGRETAKGVVELTLREGRNRQVRHMCDAIAHPVDRLRRTRIGGVSDRDLRVGQMRDLSPAEVASLVRERATSGVAPSGPRPNRRKGRPGPKSRPRGTSQPPAAAPAARPRGAGARHSTTPKPARGDRGGRTSAAPRAPRDAARSRRNGPRSR